VNQRPEEAEPTADQTPQAGSVTPDGTNTKTGTPKATDKANSDHEPLPLETQLRRVGRAEARTDGHDTRGQQMNKGRSKLARCLTADAARAARAAEPLKVGRKIVM